MIPNNQSIPELPKDPSLPEPPGSAPLPAEKAPQADAQVDSTPFIDTPAAATAAVVAPVTAVAAAAALGPAVTSPSSPSPEPPSAPTVDTAMSPPLPAIGSPLSQSSPFKTSRTALGLEDHTSDTHSIRSGRSLGSTVSTTVKHPEMHEAGLNSSFVETINATFTDGKVAKASLVGEIGLSFNPTDLNGPFGTETIRLENLGTNDKLAPNPAFIDALPDRAGHFTVNLGQITKTQVGFKYQIHVAPETAAAHVPLLLATQWRVDAKQADCRLHYTLNPAYPADSLTFSDFAVVINVDTSSGAKLQSCRASDGFKFRKESGMVYWRLGDVTLSKDAPSKPLLARIITEGEVKPGTAEARWEVNGSIGSGVILQKLEHDKGKGKEVEEDPFADEGDDGSQKEKESWKEVTAIKKWRAGNYNAS